MQFEGLQYGNYPIRGNNYNHVTWNIANNNMQLHAKYTLLDKGLRTLRVANEPTAEVHGFVINLAIDNYRPLTLEFLDWIVTLSPYLPRDADDSNFTITHKIKITSNRGPFSDTELDEFRDKLRIVVFCNQCPML